jgi:crossover junction endodeoxyribonuclease RuvC
MPSNSKPIRILGIDPGLNIAGYGVIETIGKQVRLLEAGVIRGGSSKSGTLGERIELLYCGLEDVLESLKPDVVAVEQLYSHYERPRTAILMGHARGAFLLAATRAKLPVHDYAATQVKRMLTGNGRAPKSQMQHAVKIQLNLKEVPDPPDVADALAIALCHHFFESMPKLQSV